MVVKGSDVLDVIAHHVGWLTVSALGAGASASALVAVSETVDGIPSWLTQGGIVSVLVWLNVQQRLEIRRQDKRIDKLETELDNRRHRDNP